MHLYLLVRGILEKINTWEHDLAAQYLPFKVKDKGKVVDYLAQVQVRPVRLYEVVFPEGCEKEIMAMVKPDNNVRGYERILKTLGRMLGLKKCKTDYKPALIPPKDGIGIFALGTKKDKVNFKVKGSDDIFQKGMEPAEML